MRIAALLVASLLAFAPRAHAAFPDLTAEQRQAASTRYQRYCALCHGDARQGHVNDHAPSLRSRSLLESGFPYIIGEAISYGRPGTPMGGYIADVGGPLTKREIADLVLWLREEAAVPPLDDADEEAAVAGNADHGAPLYAKHCASCHGAEGQGGTGTALGNAAMLAITPDRFLRHAITHGRDGTPMPAFADTLDATQIDDVVAFLRGRAAGWTAPAPITHTPPPLDAIVLHPDAPPPDFDLADGLYVSAAQLDRELKAGKRMVLLDTRVTSMWERAHIAGAVPAPYYSSRDEVIASLPSDGTWIVAYCECPRAAAESVVRKLRDAGVGNTAVLYEGIQGWVALGYPVVQGRAAKP